MTNPRMSMYSLASEAPGGNRGTGQQSTQVSTTTLLNAIHNIYLSAQPYRLDAGTSTVVNTWLTASQTGPNGSIGGTVDASLGASAWEHARRRAEDGCIVLGSLHESTPSVLAPFLSSLPMSTPSSLYKALDAIQPFLRCSTPYNPSTPRQAALGVTLTINLAGNLTAASIALSQGGIDTTKGLMNIPSEAGYRAFDVFYYLLTSASTPAEREFLGLKPASQYALLARSGTYDPPSYLPTADDAAAAEDFRTALKEIGIKGASHRSFISTLAGLLKLGNTLDYNVDEDVLEDVCEDCTTEDRSTFVGGLYEALVDWVITKANVAIAAQMARIKDGAESLDGRGVRTPTSNEEGEDTVCISVIEIPSPTLGKALALRGIFDDSMGINSEMIADGIEVPATGSSVLREMQNAVAEVAPDLGISSTPASRERQHELEKREEILEKIGINLGTHSRLDLPALLASSRLRAWRLPEWANRRNKNLDFTADFDVEEFVQRYSALGCKDGRDGIETWLLERGWSNGEVIVGKERVWMRESAWWEAESMLDLKPLNNLPGVGNMMAVNQLESGYSNNGSGYFPGQVILDDHSGSNGVVNHQRNFSHGNMSQATFNQNPVAAPSIAPTRMTGMTGMRNVAVVYYNEDGEFIGPLDPELANGKQIETKSLPMKRRVWVFIVWAFTWWIPSPFLRYVGRMKRPDVRMAWREKLVLCFFIFLMNALIVFWIVAFGRLLCPNFDKAYSQKEVDTHQGQSDFWQHSDQDIETTRENMLPLAGMNLDDYFVAPLPLTCPGLDIEDTFRLDLNNTLEFQIADHTSGYYQPNPATKLRAADWYSKRFEPRIKEYFHGDLVWSKGTVRKQGENDGRQWVIYDDKIYDLTNYFYTQKRLKNLGGSNFLNEKLINVIKQNPGADVTDQWNDILERAAGNATENQSAQNSMNCIRNTFYKGITDFRETPRCTVNNWLLLAFSIMLCAVILLKFVSALQFGSKRRPSPQDKFVICQVPAYTEGEESLRKALDSLTALQYDNKRKLICVICDGVIVGQGNDRPTPKIVLDILGVDPKIDPPALAFKSVGTGSEQLNYGKVYSGLYEFEGNVVPYLVVVKVGKESEQSKTKPGNRGKRDSQILLMSFLNRVHHRSPMNPLELEMFHQINNIIGVDPELYEYLFMVDADTSVREDSLNRLVAACANDGKIAGL
ncbi:Chitin synthase 6 like protein [Verticillium longisporum]|uniref:chitin synthase n=1 Tax=Verticillium longisporum TaxID=100787 RepID=A0A8I3AQJ2_VERLO|nr:Chitin synthase 6 like protein [Verticillium longisporum]